MKVAIYCRLSEEDKNKLNQYDDSESIQNQKTMLIQHALSQQWEIYNIYSDDDYAGSDRNRPAFNQLLQDAEKRKFNIVLCKTQSRFTRELELVEKYLHDLFPKWNIRFVSIVDNADTENKGNKKARQINGLINEWYLEDMSDNIKAVFNSKRKNGVYIGSCAVYGYMKDPNQKGHLIIDPEASEIVKETFELYSQGYGKVAIANIFNSRGIPNPAKYKTINKLQNYKIEKPNTGLWRYSTIGEMLRNEMYIGNMVQGRFGSPSYKRRENRPRPKDEWVIVEDTHEPIIDKKLWDSVQRRITQRTKATNKGTIGIFARKAKCIYCHFTLRSNKRENGTKYLRCPTRIISKESCEGSSIRNDVLERLVLEELRKLADEYLDKNGLADSVSLSNDVDCQIEKCKLSIKQYNQKIADSMASVKTLYTDKVKGIISEEEFISFSKEFHEDKTRYENLIKDIDQQLIQLEERRENSNNRQQIIETYVNTEHLTREMVDFLIDCVYVGKKDTKTKKIPIEIHWNF